MDPLIQLIIAVLLFACIGFGLLWICNKFWPEFPPARWICGVILLILIVSYFRGAPGGAHFWPMGR